MKAALCLRNAYVKVFMSSARTGRGYLASSSADKHENSLTGGCSMSRVLSTCQPGNLMMSAEQLDYGKIVDLQLIRPFSWECSWLALSRQQLPPQHGCFTGHAVCTTCQGSLQQAAQITQGLKRYLSSNAGSFMCHAACDTPKQPVADRAVAVF